MHTKSIYTLIPDIYELVGKKTGWFDDILASDLGREIAGQVQERFSAEERKGTLRLSKMGDECPCALWHSVHHPELAEPIQPWVQIKFIYGDIIEALIISLAKAAGHTVEGEQDAVTVDGIEGHLDCIIDGCVVDIKSVNSLGFKDFQQKKVETNPFLSAYLYQLDGYLVGSADDPRVQSKDRGYIIAVDKVLGHMVLYEHRLREDRIRERIREYKAICELSNAPGCTCGTLADGKSGNIQLDTKASYNPYKFCCKPNLRTFIYSGGPRYLTHVARLPDVPEIPRRL